MLHTININVVIRSIAENKGYQTFTKQPKKRKKSLPQQLPYKTLPKFYHRSALLRGL